MFTRRQMIKLGLLAGGSTLFGRRLGFPDGGKTAFNFWDNPQSPATRPFVDELFVPDAAIPTEIRPGLAIPEFPPRFNRPFPGSTPPDPKCLPGQLPTKAPLSLPPPACSRQIKTTAVYDITEEEALVKVHSDLCPTRVWRYRDLNDPDVPGGKAACDGPAGGLAAPVLTAHIDKSEALRVRFHNNLPKDPRPFGIPRTTVHYHGGHNEFSWDGFPSFDFRPGETFEYLYPMLDPGFSRCDADETERGATQWYHDHMIDFTAENVYAGLAGFFLAFDEKDTGDESTGLRLPSGEFDIPLVIQDRLFAPDGSLVYNSFDHDGFLGDKFLVNGVIQPFHRVRRRKYRLRFLNGSNARFYQVFLTKASGQSLTFDQIATEGGLMSMPIRKRQSVPLAPAVRADIVVDFKGFEAGTEIFLENRLEQDDGRGPKGLVSQGTPLLKFIVEGPRVDDPSQVPDVLRKFDPISGADKARARRRTIELERTHGAWAMNDQFVDLCNPLAVVRQFTPEIWHVVNKSGGWSHPIHIHHEFVRVLRRNGKTPPLDELDGVAKKETVVLGPNEDVDLFLNCRDYPGPFVFHCHNIEHEDMAMMARFDVV